jgi:hypothetical protein
MGGAGVLSCYGKSRPRIFGPSWLAGSCANRNRARPAEIVSRALNQQQHGYRQRPRFAKGNCCMPHDPALMEKVRRLAVEAGKDLAAADDIVTALRRVMVIGRQRSVNRSESFMAKTPTVAPRLPFLRGARHRKPRSVVPIDPSADRLRRDFSQKRRDFGERRASSVRRN